MSIHFPLGSKQPEGCEIPMLVQNAPVVWKHGCIQRLVVARVLLDDVHLVAEAEVPDGEDQVRGKVVVVPEVREQEGPGAKVQVERIQVLVVLVLVLAIQVLVLELLQGGALRQDEHDQLQAWAVLSKEVPQVQDQL